MPQTPDYAALAAQARQSAPVDYGALATQARADDAPASWLDSATNFVTNFAHSVDPRPALKLLYDVTEAMPGSGKSPEALIGDLRGIGQAQVDQFKKGYQAYKDGRISEAVGHTIAGALPLVGPAAARAGEQIGAGDISGGMGAAAGLLAPVALANVLPSLPTSIGARGLNPVADAAVRWGESRGIPIDAATASNSPIVASLQKRVSDSMGGAGVAERFKASQARGLATVGEQLAAKANEAPQIGPQLPGVARPMVGGAPMSPESAGAGAQSAVGDVVHQQATAATTAYDKLRAIEANPAHQRTVTMAGPDGDAQVSMALPVDLRDVKSQLTPLYTRLMQEGEVAPLMGQTATAARTLNRIVTGPDYAPLSVVDAALGELKTFARVDNPDLRSIGQGAVAQAITKLDPIVRQTAASAGPDAVKALTEGRQATIAKVAAADVLERLQGTNAEPVGAFNRLTASKDTGIGHLRDVVRQAPQVAPQIGRAVLDGLIGKATEGGGFDHAAKLAADWQRLGPQTKALLFREPGYIGELDKFFQLAKKIAENPNPSGTARINNLFNWSSTAVGYPLAKLLYSTKGVQVLTKGFTVPVRSAVAQAAYAAEVNAALATVPAMAGESPQTPGSPTAQR